MDVEEILETQSVFKCICRVCGQTSIETKKEYLETAWIACLSCGHVYPARNTATLH